MEPKIKDSLESDKEDNISWEEIYDKIPRFLKMIQQILLKNQKIKKII